jgi:hypothetical protein
MLLWEHVTNISIVVTGTLSFHSLTSCDIRSAHIHDDEGYCLLERKIMYTAISGERCSPRRKLNQARNLQATGKVFCTLVFRCHLRSWRWKQYCGV